MQSLATWIAIAAFAALAFICIRGFIRSRPQHSADELIFTTETMQSRADRKEKRRPTSASPLYRAGNPPSSTEAI
jgi:hypothetical protein